jgi:RecA/RadA recombinase
MAKYDFGGGCSCGLYKVCECGIDREIPAVKPKKEKLMGKNLFASLLKKAGNEYAAMASEGIAAGDVTGYYDTGSYTFNAALSGSIYGGLPNNGVTAFAGEPSTGKTFFALSVAKRFLDDNPDSAVYYFETESAMTQDSLINRGIDTERFGVLPVGTVEDFRTQALSIINGYADEGKEVPPMLFILDSLGGLSTNKEITDMTEGKEKRDMTRAQLIRGAFRVLTLKLGLVTVPLIVTNHVYDQVGAYIPTKRMGGGSGLEYAASTIAFLSKTKNRDDKTKKVTGAIIKCVINKGRLTKENTVVHALLDYAEGLDRYYGLLELATEFGIVTKVAGKGSVFPDGTAASEEKIEDNPEKYFTQPVLDLIEKKCNEYFKYGSAKTDKEEVAEQKAAIEALAVPVVKKKKSA